MSLSKDLLEDLYNRQMLSMAEIAQRLGCSPNKVVYWMTRYNIVRRDISQAIYQWHNPAGDPFDIREPASEADRDLFRLALGLYIGEGRKHSVADVSLANSDPHVIRVFLRFLREICGVDEKRIWAWLNIRDDVDLAQAEAFWAKATGLAARQFLQPVVRARRGGTYKHLSEYGTLTVGVTNTKLRQQVLRWCEEYLEQHS